MGALPARVSRGAQRLLWLPIGHLAAVSIAGSLAPPAPLQGRPRTRFCVLIPARNEEAHVGQAVSSVLATRYPSALRRLIVVADNCTDRTAEVARESGAEVWVRTNEVRRGKGEALVWALDRVLASNDWDAVVLIDADCTMDREFLGRMDQRVAAGAVVVQGEVRPSNAGDSVVSRLAEVSGAAQYALRPRGRARLGAAVRLHGKGMVFHRQVLAAHPWDAASLTEDFEYWLTLVRSGIRPVHEAGAIVNELVPVDVGAARIQRTRWETGRLDLLRRELVSGLRTAFRRRDVVLGEALVAEVAMPSLSVIGALVAASGIVRWSTERRGAGSAAAQAAVLGAHLVLALRAADAPPASYWALALAPPAAAWRVWIAVESALAGRRLEWRGTPRGTERRRLLPPSGCAPA